MELMIWGLKSAGELWIFSAFRGVVILRGLLFSGGGRVRSSERKFACGTQSVIYNKMIR